jgi:rod shape-determining protein MreC
MRNLISFIVKYSYWFLFFVLEAIGFALLFNFNSYQGSVYFTSANNVSGAFYKGLSELTTFMHLKAINTKLEEDNEALRMRVAALEKHIESTDSTKGIINYIHGNEYKLLSAKVVKSTMHRSNNYLTIDKGKADGIKPEMGVICSSGIVGIVYLTSDHYSIVLPVVSQKSRISCKIQNTKYFGMLQWQRGAINISYVMDVPRHATVRKGETVETNGYSAVFPAGIPVGKVLEVEDSPDGLAFMLRVKLFTDFARLRDVSVITNFDTAERKSLELKADSLNIPN